MKNPYVLLYYLIKETPMCDKLVEDHYKVGKLKHCMMSNGIVRVVFGGTPPASGPFTGATVPNSSWLSTEVTKADAMQILSKLNLTKLDLAVLNLWQ